MTSTTDDPKGFWAALAGLLEDGRPLLDALRAARAECVSAQVSGAIAKVADMVAEGALLSDGLAAQPGFFGPGAVFIVRGGEHLGMMDRAARFVADASVDCPTCAAWRGQEAD